MNIRKKTISVLRPLKLLWSQACQFRRVWYQAVSAKPPYFTLIELLVVIAIIAILASMLLPSLAKARERSKEIVCRSQAKQIAYGLITYQADFDGYIPPYADYTIDPPPTGSGASSYSWTANLVLNKYISGELFVCPAKKSVWEIGGIKQEDWYKNASKYNANQYFWGYPDYGLNIFFGCDYYATGNPLSTYTKITRVKQPSQTIFVVDSADDGVDDRDTGRQIVYSTYQTNYYIAWPTHNGTCNVGWVDGHVSGVRTSGGATEAGAQNLYTDSKLTNRVSAISYWDFD